MEGRLEAADAAFIDEQWRRLWGLPVVSLDREYRPTDVEGLVYRDEAGCRRASSPGAWTATAAKS